MRPVYLMILLWSIVQLQPAIGADGEYKYRASGTVERDGSKRSLPWETSGRIFAPDFEAARSKASEEVDQFLKQNYPAWREAQNSRKVNVLTAYDSGLGGDHTTLRLQLTCLGAIVREKPVLTILNWDAITEEQVYDNFTVRIIVEANGREQTIESDIATLGRGGTDSFARYFDVWSGELSTGDAERSFSFRVLQKDIPELQESNQDKKANPADPNDGFTELGRFSVNLKVVSGQLQADWVASSKTVATESARRGPGMKSQRFTVRNPDAVPFGIEIYAERRSDIDRAREKELELGRQKEEAMRKKLAAAGDAMVVYTGTLEGTRDGSNVGIGAVVVVSADLESGKAYLAKEFPGQSELGIAVAVKTEDEGKQYLLDRFKKLVPNGVPGEPQLTKKVGRTLMDDINDLPGRRPQPR